METSAISTDELHPRQQALIDAVQQAGRTGVLVAGPQNTALASDLERRGLIRLESLPGGQPQPAFLALPKVGCDAAGYPFERVVAMVREWAMLRWEFNDVGLIDQAVQRTIEAGEAISPRTIAENLARRFGLQDPLSGNTPRDQALRTELTARGDAAEREWQEARAKLATAAPVRALSAAERARAQLLKR